jgi:sugar phosphate isomerase/epimerase
MRLHGDDWKTEVEKIAQAVNDTGIKLAQCHLPFKGKKVKCHTPEDLEYYYTMFYRAIDVAAFLEIPWGVIHPNTFKGQTLSDDECVRINHEENDRYIEYALNKNVNIAYENMVNGYCTSVDQLADLIDSYKDNRIGACLDTGHANTYYKDQYEAIVRLGHRLRCTHINDNNGKDDLHLAPFSGTVKWESVMKALRDINYPGVLNLEIGINNTAPENLKDSGAKYALDTLRSLTTI